MRPLWSPLHPLSKREIACLALIKGYIAIEHRAPTLNEIGTGLDISKSQADQVITLLRRRKLLKRGEERSRRSRSGALEIVSAT